MDDDITISDYDPAWPTMYAEEAKQIRGALGPGVRDIRHIGSTAVPDLAAKPIIDIMVAQDDIVSGRESTVRSVAPLGYINVPHDDAERLFFMKGMPRTHHLHIVRYRSWTYYKHIMFRDYLIDHPISAEEYECLKRVLAGRHRKEREAYLKGKEDFIEMILSRAEKERIIVPE